VQELKTLTRDQDALIQMQTRLVNQLTACLKDYYPLALQLFAQLQQRSTLLFLQTYPTPQRAMGASREQILHTLKQAGHTNPEKAAHKIFEALHQDIASYDKEIERLFLGHAESELFTSLPRAGKRLAPRLLAEIGDDPERYADASSLQALAGTSPVLFQSGTYAKAHRRQGCVKPLRNALSQFAWQSTQQEAWARAYYERKRAEGKSHSVAVQALSNIWARILFAMLKSHEPYASATFETAKRLHAPKAA
jgi:transposase